MNCSIDGTPAKKVELEGRTHLMPEFLKKSHRM